MAIGFDNVWNRSRPGRPGLAWWGAAVLLLALFLAYYAPLALQKHGALLTGVDLADVHQALWSTAHGRPFEMSTRPGLSSRLGIHVEPALLALVPIYSLAPSAETLLLVQAVALALVALPLYALAAEVLAHPALALAIPLLYLLSPAVHNAVLSDFYPVTLGVLPAVAALAALWRGHTRAALLLGGLALLAREDYGLWLAALAVVGWWRTRQKVWIAAGVAGLAWFLAVTLLIVPAFTGRSSSLFWSRYGFWLEGPEAWRAQGLLPEKGRYLVQLLLMGGAGALLAPLWALPALPVLGLNLLSNFHLPVSLQSYYSTLIVPTLLAAAALGLRRLAPAWQAAALLVLLAAGVAVHRAEGRSPLAPGFVAPRPEAHAAAFQALANQVPADAALSASGSLAPHLADRAWLRFFPNERLCHYALADLTRDHSRHPVEMRDRVYEMLDGGWGVVDGRDGLLLLAEGAAGRELPAEFYSFVQSEARPQYAAAAQFGDGWALEGYDVEWDYWGRAIVRLHWRILQPIEGEWQPAAMALDAEGAALATPDTHPPPALLWLPTWRWQPGETYVVEMLPFEASGPVTLVAGVGTPLADKATRQRTGDGQDLLLLATIERRGWGWQVQPLAGP